MEFQFYKIVEKIVLIGFTTQKSIFKLFLKKKPFFLKPIYATYNASLRI